MKRTLLMLLLIFTTGLIYSQTTYYWVGGTALTGFSGSSNWNTLLDGSGSPRTTASGSDIMIIDGSNIGGSTPATGTVNISITSTSISQLILTNNAIVNMQRPAGGGGTGTLTISGGNGDDFVIDPGSSLTVNSSSSDGNVQFTFGAVATGLVKGTFAMMNTGTHRMNLPGAGSLVFASGSKFISNIRSGSASYPFGSSSQSAEKAVIFQSGASLYYEGGYSPMGNSSTFSAIYFEPGSNWYHHATNPTSGSGSFFNTKSFGNIIVENNATLASDGPIYRIGNLTISAGSSFTTHTSGQTGIFGDVMIDGSISGPAGSTNIIVMAGATPQTISGAGSINFPNLVVAQNSEVLLSTDISVAGSTNIFGKINFATAKLSSGSFTAQTNSTATAVTGNLVAGSYQITGTVGTLAGLNGLTITGAGIAPNTSVVGFSSGGATINLSKPIVTGGTTVALSFSSDKAVLATSNPNGFDPAAGSVSSATQTFKDGTSYIINAATSTPFGVTTGSSSTLIDAGFVEINAPVTVNKSVTISDHLLLNAKLTLQPADVLHLASGAVINGNTGPAAYIVTTGNASTGEQGIVQYDGISGAVTIPVGTINNYLPVTLQPSSSSDFTISVFEGITDNGALNGAAFTALQKQTVVDAVWTINRVNGTGTADVQLQWDPALEGSTFTTLPDTDIGVISNTGTSWTLPLGPGDNTANTATATVSSFGSFSAGAVPQVQPFVFNPLPARIYGDADFNGGATSLNTSQPIVYSSSNPAIATIVAGNIHITGTGSVTITASQASDGFYPAASVDQSLVINKAELTIKADDKLKFEGLPNPTLTASYTGFAYGETPAVLLTQPVLATTAVTGSAPGAYPITVSGATADNYTISFVDGTLTVQAKQNQVITFNTLPVKTYGNADFAVVATSTNATIPVVLTSSNTGVAIASGNTIHITGAGTTTITATQAGNDGYFEAAPVARTLTVNKAALAIKVRDTTKVEGTVNPAFTITYTGFVLGETASNLSTAPVVNTTAATNSSAGYYPLTPAGAASGNYNITYTAGRLTILPAGADTTHQHIQAYMKDNNTLSVRLYSPYPALTDLVIFDMNGKAMLRRNVFMPQGFISVDLDISILPSGIYAVAARGGGVNLRRLTPIIKQ